MTFVTLNAGVSVFTMGLISPGPVLQYDGTADAAPANATIAKVAMIFIKNFIIFDP